MDELLDIILLVIFVLLFYGGIYYLVRFILGLIFDRNKSNWAIRLFRNHSQVDLDNVKKQVARKDFPAKDLNAWEMIAVLCLFIYHQGASETIRLAERFGDHGWGDKYDTDFYSILEQTARKISNSGKKKRARQLLYLGQRLGEKYNNKYWTEKYRELLNLEHASNADIEWDRSRRMNL